MGPAARVGARGSHRRVEERIQHRAAGEHHHDPAGRRPGESGQRDTCGSVSVPGTEFRNGVRAAEIPARIQAPILNFELTLHGAPQLTLQSARN